MPGGHAPEGCPSCHLPCPRAAHAAGACTLWTLPFPYISLPFALTLQGPGGLCSRDGVRGSPKPLCSGCLPGTDGRRQRLLAALVRERNSTTHRPRCLQAPVWRRAHPRILCVGRHALVLPRPPCCKCLPIHSALVRAQSQSSLVPTHLAAAAGVVMKDDPTTIDDCAQTIKDGKPVW